MDETKVRRLCEWVKEQSRFAPRSPNTPSDLARAQAGRDARDILGDLDVDEMSQPQAPFRCEQCGQWFNYRPTKPSGEPYHYLGHGEWCGPVERIE